MSLLNYTLDIVTHPSRVLLDFDLPAVKCFIIANVTFWCCSFACMVLDFCVPRSTGFGKFLHSYKVQGEKSFFTMSHMLQTLGVAFINMILIGPLIVLAFHALWSSGVGGWYTPVPESAPFSWKRELLCFLGFVCIIDIWFYWTHRLIHHPLVYDTIHRKHHRWTAPCAAAAVYAHPFEFVVGNVAGIALGPILTNSHPYTAYFWFFFTLFRTCGAHSGYYFLGAARHDAHHEFFKYEFGVGPFCDYIFRTKLPKHLKDKQRGRSKA